MPKVSVIIPVYAVEKYIERCVRSLFEQTLDDIEYLFIDDCTPDKSIVILYKVLEDYPQRKSQVVVHRMERNSGQALVRKWGIMNASGDYIIHCDSDDWVDLEMYQQMYETALKNDSDIVACNFVSSDGQKIVEEYLGCHNEKPGVFFENILNRIDHGSLCNKLVRRKLYQGNIIWPEGAMGEDLLMSLQLVYFAQKVKYIPKAYYFYYENPVSITKSYTETDVLHRFHESVKNAEGLLLFFETNNLSKKYQNQLDKMLLSKKNLIVPILHNKEYSGIWNKTFPDLYKRVFSNPLIPFKDKIKYYLVSIRAFMYSIF